MMIPASLFDVDIPEFNSMMLSSTVKLTQWLVVVVPLTVKSPDTANAPDTVVKPVTVKFNAPVEVTVKSVPSD